MENLNEKFSLIYDQYIEKIYRFVYLKVSSRENAEDITSKVFLKGWESYQKDQSGIKNMNAFLYQIARNAVVDHYRDHSRTKSVSADYNKELIDSKTNLYEKALINEDIGLVKASIQNLDKDYQDIIIWYYLEDMSAEQIGQILNRPAGTVRVMIHRGLEALKGELRGEA